eukprot:gene17029-20830_t
MFRPNSRSGPCLVMMYFARWKTAAILLVCLVGTLVSLPNLLPRAAFPDWAPVRQIALGLDLRGGSYLLLEVDTSVLLRERLESLVEGTRRGMGYNHMARVTSWNPAQRYGLNHKGDIAEGFEKKIMEAFA